jgi:hypothetical protein
MKGRRYVIKLGDVVVDEVWLRTHVWLGRQWNAKKKARVVERQSGKATRNPMMTHKYRGSQQSLREVLPKFIDSTQGEPKNICKP